MSRDVQIWEARPRLADNITLYNVVNEATTCGAVSISASSELFSYLDAGDEITLLTRNSCMLRKVVVIQRLNDTTFLGCLSGAQYVALRGDLVLFNVGSIQGINARAAKWAQFLPRGWEPQDGLESWWSLDAFETACIVIAVASLLVNIFL